MQIQNTNGLETTKFWIGEIEDRIDPLGLGRCKVRVFGFHPEKSKNGGLDTDELPWMHPVFGFNVSKTFSVPNVGDWVLGMFLDGESAQFGLIMGVIPGLKKKK